MQIGQDQAASGAEIFIGVGLLHRVVHVEVVGDGERASRVRDLHEGVAVVAVDGKALRVQGGVEGAVGIEEVDVAGGIGRQPVAGHPDRALIAVGSDVDHRSLRQRAGVVGHQPAGVGAIIAVRGERDVDRGAIFQQTSALGELSGSKNDLAVLAAVAGAGIGGLQSPWDRRTTRHR